jgi:hypothetical protein
MRPYRPPAPNVAATPAFSSTIDCLPKPSVWRTKEG